MFAINTQYAVRRLLPFIFSIFLGCILHGQAFSQIVINEIIQNPAAVSDAVGEWFEVFNPGGSPVDINGWTIRDNDFDSHVIDNSGPLMVPAGGFLVLGINADFAANGGVTVGYQYSDLFLANGADELVLLDTTMAEIDRVEWDGGPSFPDPNGASMSLVGPGLDNNVGANWCEAPTPFGAGDRGTPGAANDCPIGPPLVINEIDYDQPGLDLAEFIEIKNTGNSIESLSGVTLLLVNGATGASYGSFPLPSVSLAPGDYFVVCTNAATVQNCDLDVLSSIQNGSPDAVALIFSGVVFDAVSYEGDTVAPYTEGSGSGLEDSGASGQDFKGIGRFPDGVDTDQNNVDLVNSCITPGRPNTSLSGNCAPGGPALEIFEVQGSGLASPSAGQAVSLADNAVTALGTNGFFIQTPSARTDGDVDTSDGIFVFTGGAPAVSVGDRVDVTGNVIEFFGFTEVTGSPSVSVTGSGAVPDPVSFDPTVPSPDPLAPSCAIELECYEGMLVEIANGSVTGPNQRFGSDPIAEVFVVARPNRAFREPGIEFPGISGYPVWDGNPEVIELDPDKLGLPNQIIPAGSSFSGIGVLGYEFGGYEFWPRELTFTPAPLPVPVRGRDEGEVTVATLNLFRLFDDFDDPPSV
ncbi:MAG: lamin tail domain-containing protein, partial [Acidobacteriota bacterium]|nr:lamin tail domain-containing protein [Acidobacteriota bacterium]